mgnify:CR=1 FL=1
MKFWRPRLFILPIAAILLMVAPVQAFGGLQSNQQPQQEVTPDVSYIITSTPNPDGSIVHVVKEGETLWAISLAYGVTGEQIQVNSGNSPAATEVYIGQVLIIKLPDPATATPENTATPTRITPSATTPRPTRTPHPTKTPLPSPTPTLDPPMTYKVFGNSQRVGLAMFGISGIGVVLVILFGFVKKEK